MGSLGFGELLLILLLFVIIFGAKRLPDIGRGLGEAIRNFKKSLSSKESTKEIKKEADKEDR